MKIGDRFRTRIDEAIRRENPDVGPDLSGANLKDADLTGTDLTGADLIEADLSRAHLTWADLSGAYLSGANLSGANLSGANLSGAHLSGADLSGTDLSTAIIGWTALANVDLSKAKGLETVEHDGPSLIGIDTIYKSKGQIPEAFLHQLLQPGRRIRPAPPSRPPRRARALLVRPRRRSRTGSAG